MKKLRNLTLIGFSFSLVILLSLVMPLFTIVDNATHVVTENITCIEFLKQMFNGGLEGDNIGLMIGICYIMLLFLSLMFFVFALLRTKRVFIYRRWLVAITMVMLIVSVVMLVLCFIFANQHVIYSGLIITREYHVSLSAYLNFLLSIYIFISVLIIGTYCVQNKK